jgi:hypothetical protein
MGANRKRKRPRGTGESGVGADELESEEGEGEDTDGEEVEGEGETRGESSGSLEQVGNGPVSSSRELTRRFPRFHSGPGKSARC